MDDELRTSITPYVGVLLVRGISVLDSAGEIFPKKSVIFGKGWISSAKLIGKYALENGKGSCDAEIKHPEETTRHLSLNSFSIMISSSRTTSRSGDVISRSI